MNTKEIREVLRNELECVKRQMGTMCANGRDCINCDLALPDDVVISAYESVLSLINRPKAEIEPFCIAVTRERFPNMQHLGSVTAINGAEITPVDIITFGSPCQDHAEKIVIPKFKLQCS